MSITISLITVCYNAEATIGRCIRSVASQNYPHVEYIVIDGQSTDDTWQVITAHAHFITKKILEPDKGLYDAINKGIKMATGEVIGLIHADDYLADENVLADIAAGFENDQQTDAVFGNLIFQDPAGKTVRTWLSCDYSRKLFTRGWMPPHPTFYVRRKYFEQFGYYDMTYGSAADYELMLRFLYTHHLKAMHINRVLVHMQTGGVSNRSLANRIKASYADFTALKKHHLPYPFVVLVKKITGKIKQWWV